MSLQPWRGPVASAQATVERANATASKVNRARIRDMRPPQTGCGDDATRHHNRSEEHTSELQSRLHLVCRLLLEKKKKTEQPLDRSSSRDTTSVQSRSADACSQRLDHSI